MERLSLSYPLRPYLVNQLYAENYPCVKDFGKPTQHIVMGGATTCPVGYEKLYQQWDMRGHNGADLASGEQPVYAAAGGVVIEMQTVPARGLGVGVLTKGPVLLDCGEHHAKLRYWHLKSIAVPLGATVRPGDLLGITDNTGYSSGNHLHFELQPMNKDRGGHPKLVNPPGHIAGAVDPLAYWDGRFAEDLQWRRDLFLGSVGDDVLRLQRHLNKGGFAVAASGPGSPGKETRNYGPLTAAAVMRMQAALGVSPTAGYFGRLTREAVHASLYGPR